MPCRQPPLYHSIVIFSGCGLSFSTVSVFFRGCGHAVDFSHQWPEGAACPEQGAQVVLFDGFFAVPVGLELAEGTGVDPVVVDADVSQVVVAVDFPGLVFHTGPWAVGDDVADVVEPHDAGDGAAAVPESGLAEDDDGMRELEVTQVVPLVGTAFSVEVVRGDTDVRVVFVDGFDGFRRVAAGPAVRTPPRRISMPFRG